MTTSKRLISESRCCIFASAIAIVFVSGSFVDAAIMLTADPSVPDSPNVFTTDPAMDPNIGERGVAGTRMIRQTFKNFETFTVAEILLAYDVTSGTGGIGINFYEVEDVNGANWDATSPSAPIHSFLHTPDLPGTTDRLGIALTGPDAFELPARFEGTTGYAIEITAADGVSNPGVLIHTSRNEEDEDLYTDGKYYADTGASTNGNRDLGVWLSATTGPLPIPGDVNDDGEIDLDDLEVIRANFRLTVTSREEGDLTGEGFVDLHDFREWKANYPLAGSGTAFHFAVPEPSTLLLTACGLVALVAGACRKSVARKAG